MKKNLIAGIAILAAIFFSISSYATYQATRHMDAYRDTLGSLAEVSYEGISANPFSGTATIKNLSLVGVHVPGYAQFYRQVALKNIDWRNHRLHFLHLEAAGFTASSPLMTNFLLRSLSENRVLHDQAREAIRGFVNKEHDLEVILRPHAALTVEDINGLVMYAVLGSETTARKALDKLGVEVRAVRR